MTDVAPAAPGVELPRYLEAEDVVESLRYAALAVQERELPLLRPA